MFLLCYAPEGHKLLLNTRNNLGSLAIEIDKLHVHQKRSWNLSISLVSDPTRKWILLCSQVFTGWSLITQWPPMSFGTIVNWSQVAVEIFISCKLLSSLTGNSRRLRPGHGWSLIRRKASDISRRSFASVSQWSGHECDSGAWVYADKLTNGMQGSRACKSVMVQLKSLLLLGQSYIFCLLVCQSLSNIDVNSSLRSNNKSSMTTHEPKKSRIFQLENRS